MKVNGQQVLKAFLIGGFYLHYFHYLKLAFLTMVSVKSSSSIMIPDPKKLGMLLAYTGLISKQCAKFSNYKVFFTEFDDLMRLI
jgi:hypothetical protein